MERGRTYGLAFATAMCAFGIGYVMQFGLGLPGARAVPDAPVEVTAITDTSAAMPLSLPDRAVPELPRDAEMRALPEDAGFAAPVLPDTPATLVALDADAPAPQLPEVVTEPGAPKLDPTAASCDIAMTADPMAGALVRLTLDAPCKASERVTLHHNGMMVTEVTDEDGTLEVEIPALAERAVFIASFGDESGAVAQAEVSSMPFYDRVVLQWESDAGLELHAREFGADYFTEGHVWHDARGSIEKAAAGEGGFLIRLGDADTAKPRLAEIYSFPAGTSQRSGRIDVSVEAEVTETNCGLDVSAQTMTLTEGGAPDVRDLVLSMPDCQSTGDFLVLKNLVEDLKIAAD